MMVAWAAAIFTNSARWGSCSQNPETLIGSVAVVANVMLPTKENSAPSLHSNDRSPSASSGSDNITDPLACKTMVVFWLGTRRYGFVFAPHSWVPDDEPSDTNPDAIVIVRTHALVAVTVASARRIEIGFPAKPS